VGVALNRGFNAFHVVTPYLLKIHFKILLLPIFSFKHYLFCMVSDKNVCKNERGGQEKNKVTIYDESRVTSESERIFT
jgi:hypothetical protein